jgi:hypothetical protein
MSQNNLVPFAAGAKPSAAFAAALNTADHESLADGIGSSYGIIGYKGKVWSLRYHGEKHVFTRPDDNSPTAHIDVIILRAASVKSKSYYGKYDPNASEGVRPICASLDGIKPDADVQQKQSDVCAICPRNVWKAGTDGKKSRECTDYKRLAVLLLPNQTQRLLGAALMEPVFLRIPPASLQPLATYGEQLNMQGFHYSSVATRITFDPNEPHPKMVFAGLQALTDAEAPVVLPMREDPQSLRITGEDQMAAHTGPLQVTGQAQPAQQLAAPSVDLPKAATAPSVPQATDLGLTAIVPAAAVPQTATTISPSKPGGLLELTATAVAPGAPGGGPAAVADTGEVTASDAALDARIKGLLNP